MGSAQSGNGDPRTQSQRRRGRSAAARKEAQQRAAEQRRRVRNLQLTAAIAALVVVAIVGGSVWNNLSSRPAAGEGTVPSSSAPTAMPTLTEQTRFLSGDAQSRVVLVEFLDFECEGCAAVFPSIEQLRQRNDGTEVAIAVKYFPLDSHFNARRAARAVEAAAQQDQFVEMYKLMYQTQLEWGEQQTPMDARFRGYAQQLGLDLDAWDAAYTASATEARIQADVTEGLALGVTGTPTFFLNGSPLQPQSEQDLIDAIDAELAR